MPIYGVGIDIVVVARLEKSLERFGARFESRVFTDFELEYCSARKGRTACLAMRFAAKEAFVKAMGLGMRKPLLWRDIEVRPDALGKPEIALSPRALDYCAEKGVRFWHLSLTDEGEYAAAVVVTESG
ncbi:MAG: holo-ACP synthase [Syntrophobacteraceae bacterium]